MWSDYEIASASKTKTAEDAEVAEDIENFRVTFLNLRLLRGLCGFQFFMRNFPNLRAA